MISLNRSLFFFFSSRRRHTRCALVTGVQTCALPISEKRFVAGLGGRTAPFAPVPDRAALDAAIAEIGAPAILKTARMGYDGKGQARLADASDADEAWETIGRHPAILEGFVAFAHEFSVLLVRGAGGETRFWDSPPNVPAGAR